jgi:5'-nucleotidase
VRILVTNDDGVSAPGIASAARALVKAGHDVTIVAPTKDHSGSSAATGLQLQHSVGTLVFEAVELEALPDVPAFAVAALPSVCVSLALAGSFGPPADLVVSGINRGRNTGRFVLHSGTVGAALTAAQLGRSAIAVGLQAKVDNPVHDDTAAGIAAALIGPLTAMRPGTVLNCNVPDLPPERLRGVRRAELSDADVFHVVNVDASQVRVTFGFAGHPEGGDDDWALGADDYATVTAITYPAADPDPAVQALVASCVAELDACFAPAADVPAAP